MRLAIDCDGVLSDFTSAVREAANRLWPGKMPDGYIPSNWNYEGVLTKEEWNQVWAELMQTEDLWFNLPSLDGVSHLQSFLDKNPTVQIYFITSRPQTKGMSSLVQTTQWLEKRRLWSRFDRSQIIVVNKPEEKAKYLKALEIPFYLDDHGPTIKGLQTTQEGLDAYLLDAPYNQAYSLPRVSSVKEYLQIVEGDVAYPW